MNTATIAAARFGFGVIPEAAASDPQAWLIAQIDQPVVLSESPKLPTSSFIFAAEEKLVAERKNQKKGAEVEATLTDDRKRQGELYRREIDTRYLYALDGQQPFIERLVVFWSNHFTVSGTKGRVRPLAGSFEREAIRPNVTGSFERMLLDVVTHPAMGLYLDNAVSVGPESRAGQMRGKGLNENLGRELLELHTLGVDGGYTEEDVRALARILTGWSISRQNEQDPGRFMFRPAIHEPGSQRLLGKVYAEDGARQGLAAMHDLAHHPATANHIARKLAVHFIADEPPAESVAELADVFYRTGGNLSAVSKTLVSMTTVWSNFRQKVKSPWDLVVSASAVTGIRLLPDKLVATLDQLGQPVFMAPQPPGWSDMSSEWLAPDAVLRRLAWCDRFAALTDPNVDPAQIMQTAFRDAVSHETSDAVLHAESRKTAVALLLASPEFQRR